MEVWWRCHRRRRSIKRTNNIKTDLRVLIIQSPMLAKDNGTRVRGNAITSCVSIFFSSDEFRMFPLEILMMQWFYHLCFFGLPDSVVNVASLSSFIGFSNFAGPLMHLLMNFFLSVSPVVTVVRRNVAVDSLATFPFPVLYKKFGSISALKRLSVITFLKLSCDFLILCFFRSDDFSSFFVNPGSSNT